MKLNQILYRTEMKVGGMIHVCNVNDLAFERGCKERGFTKRMARGVREHLNYRKRVVNGLQKVNYMHDTGKGQADDDDDTRVDIYQRVGDPMDTKSTKSNRTPSLDRINRYLEINLLFYYN